VPAAIAHLTAKAMSLDYNNAFHCRCSISLPGERRITLKSLTQELTYGGLLVGTPTSEINDRKLQSTIDRVSKEAAALGHAPFLVPPARRGFLREPGDMATIQRGSRIPEWMPAVTCIGRFDSLPAKDRRMHGSQLVIVWLQDDYALPISQSALQAIRGIDWTSHAVDFEY
jgi:hypothetical protein